MTKTFLEGQAQPGAGDQPSTFLGQESENNTAKPYAPSDIPGFVHPIVGDKPNTRVYIAEAGIEAGDFKTFTREQAEKLAVSNGAASADEFYPESKKKG